MKQLQIFNSDELDDDLKNLNKGKTKKNGPNKKEERNRRLDEYLNRVYFSDIGGCKEAKKKLIEVANFYNYKNVFEKFGAEPPSGILLYGKPGNGKSMLAKATATELRGDFTDISPEDYGSKFIYQAEKNLDKMLKKINKKSKEAMQVIFFDEAERLGAGRKGNNYRHEALNVILRHMDGVKERNNGILYMFATNKVDQLDSALIRPGRIDYKLEIKKPNLEEKVEIFDIHLSRYEDLAQRTLYRGKSENLKDVLKDKNYSGADIAEVVRRTIYEKAQKIVEDHYKGDKEMDKELKDVYFYKKDFARVINEYERTDYKEQQKIIGFEN